MRVIASFGVAGRFLGLMLLGFLTIRPAGGFSVTPKPPVPRMPPPLPQAGSAEPVPAGREYLIQPEDLEYLGAFRLPSQVEGLGEQCNRGYGGTSYGWSYGGYGATYYPGGDPEGPDDGFPGSIFGVGHPYEGCVSEVGIPEPVISPDKDLDDLPVAESLQPFADVTGGRQTGGLTGTVLGDVQYYPRQGEQSTDKLYWVMYEYYLPEPDAAWHGWSELDLRDPRPQGTWRLDDFPAAATSRYLFDIPQEWADAYAPGKYLAAGRSRLVNQGSWGPALYAFGPWNDGNPPPDGSAVEAAELLKYPDEDHALRDYSNADVWSDGAWLTAGRKSAVVFAGTKAVRVRAGGLQYYGEPNVDGCGYKGYHGEPYCGAILFYDPMLLAEVARGRLEPYQVQPYAVLNVENYLFAQGCRRDILGGVAYDRYRNLLYVMEMKADGFYERRPIVHVFRVRDGDRGPDLSPPTPPRNLRVEARSSVSVTLGWDPAEDDVRVAAYLLYRNGEPFAITSQTSYVDDKVNPSATYTYTVVALDAGNNPGELASVVVTTPSGVDEHRPIVYGVRAIPAGAEAVAIVWHTDEPARSLLLYGPSQPSLAVEDPALVTTHRITLTGLSPGTTYVYRITCTDTVGYVNEYPNRTFTTSASGGLANSPPVLNGIGAKRLYAGETLRFTLTAYDLDGDALVFEAEGLPAGASLDTATGEFLWTPGAEDVGIHRVTFTVSDGKASDGEEVVIFVWGRTYLPLLLKDFSPS